MKRLLILMLMAGAGKNLSAQWGCLDTIRRTPLYLCQDRQYIPVCGCDGITYRNACAAYWRAGVNTWTGGVCNGFHVDVFPNPVSGSNPINVNLSFPDNVYGNLIFRVIDAWGSIVYQRFFTNMQRTEFFLDPGFMRQGFYVILVIDSRGNFQAFRFARA